LWKGGFVRIVAIVCARKIFVCLIKVAIFFIISEKRRYFVKSNLLNFRKLQFGQVIRLLGRYALWLRGLSSLNGDSLNGKP
jgi:hypothetical protein